MDKILFSFIVPCYNVQDYLENCITSILEQTYQNYEIILIDGTVRRMISRKAEIDEIKEYLNLEQGLETLQDQAVQLVKDGITTVAELNKIKVYSD